RANFTLRTRRPHRSHLARDSLRSCWTCGANWSLSSRRTLRTKRALSTSLADGTLRASLTLRTHRTDFSLSTSRASRTLRTHGAQQSNLTPKSLWTHELGIVRRIDLHLALAALILAQHETPISSGLVRLAQHVCRRQVSSER